MELMDDIFRSFVLQLVVVQVLRGSSTTFTHFFSLMTTTSCCGASGLVLFSDIQVEKKRKKRESTQITCVAPILTQIKVPKNTF